MVDEGKEIGPGPGRTRMKNAKVLELVRRELERLDPALEGNETDDDYRTGVAFPVSTGVRKTGASSILSALVEIRILRGVATYQVRNMVGTLRLVGEARWPPEQVRTALEARDRRAAGPTAPPDGLTLVSVHYARDPFSPGRR